MSPTGAGDRLGPVELLVMEFPRGQVSGAGFATMTDLVDRGVIAVLDLKFVRHRPDGAVEHVDVADAVADSPDDLGYLVGASTGLIDAGDVAEVGESIEPGSLAGLPLLEHVWVVPMVDAIEAGGAKVLLSTRVEAEAIESALARQSAEAAVASTDAVRDGD